jgi:endonuclease/exonuclease/phosphatase (EEP) superfamily protein YafD
MNRGRPLGLFGALIVSALAVVTLIELGLAIVRPEDGLPAVLQVLAPHIALIGLVLALLALALRNPTGATVALVLIAVVGIRFGGEWISLPTGSPTAHLATDGIQVETWNLEVDSRSPDQTVAFLLAHPADLVALQELQRSVAERIAADPGLHDRYPYQSLHPGDGFDGLGLLSRYPISGDSVSYRPAILEANVMVGAQSVAIVNAHPIHGDIARFGTTRVPSGVDVANRNDDLDAIRGRVDHARAAGQATILLGDLNTASSEPAHDRLVAGLRDVHAEVGEGTGWTWRPSSLEFLGVGLIRIDYVIVSPDVTPVSIADICPAIGDHCLVSAAVDLPAP